MTHHFDFEQARMDPDALFFTANDLNVSTNMIVKLMRNFFYHEKITNREYIERYYRHYTARFPDRCRTEFVNKAMADYKFVKTPNKITFNMAAIVLEAMGFEIENVLFDLKKKQSDERLTISSSK
jgi:hypothetical protein